MQSMQMRMAAAALAIAAGGASACSTVMVHPAAGAHTVSARTLDFAADLNTTIAFVPAGSTLWTNLYPEDLVGSAANASAASYRDGQPLTQAEHPELYFTANHSFLALVGHPFFNSATADLLNISTEHRLLYASQWTVTFDGVNDKGLSCSLLYDNTISHLFGETTYPESNTTDTSRPNVFSVFSLGKYVMASFEFRWSPPLTRPTHRLCSRAPSLRRVSSASSPSMWL